jgi:hypothetical protein
MDETIGNPGLVPEADKAKHPGGRPTLYKPEYCRLATNLCLLGATDKELAASFDVCEDTINEWKNVHPEFSDSIKEGREPADAEVAASLYKRATGFTGPDGVYHAPDTGAALAWLANRTRKRENVWKTRHDHQQVEGSLSLADLAARVGGADEPADG